MPTSRRASTVPLLAAVLATTAMAVVPTRAEAAPQELIGTFRIDAGECPGEVSGSYLRLVLPSGTLDGPFVENADSACADQSYTPLSPGSDGGLVTGGYQPVPDPAFDADGNSLADRINQPVRFFGVDFSASTNPVDPQTGEDTAVPALRHDAGAVTGDLSAFAATWNRQAFNQGAPKPDGSSPGNTTAVSGTFDPASGRYSITWASHIVGGPFNNFTGVWHLEGTFVPAGSTPSAPATTAPPGPDDGGSGGPVTSATSGPDDDGDSGDDSDGEGEAGDPDDESPSGPDDERPREESPAPDVDLDSGDEDDSDDEAAGAPGAGDDDQDSKGVAAAVAFAALAAAGYLLLTVRRVGAQP